MRYLLTGIVITVGVINVALFCVWLSLVKVEAAKDINSEYVYNSLTMQFTILELLLVIAAFITAILALFGYQTIKEGAENKAIETAQEFFREQGSKLISDEVAKRTIINPAGNYSLDEAIGKKSNTEKESEDI